MGAELELRSQYKVKKWKQWLYIPPLRSFVVREQTNKMVTIETWEESQRRVFVFVFLHLRDLRIRRVLRNGEMEKLVIQIFSASEVSLSLIYIQPLFLFWQLSIRTNSCLSLFSVKKRGQTSQLHRSLHLLTTFFTCLIGCHLASAPPTALELIVAKSKGSEPWWPSG